MFSGTIYRLVNIFYTYLYDDLINFEIENII